MNSLPESFGKYRNRLSNTNINNFIDTILTTFEIGHVDDEGNWYQLALSEDITFLFVLGANISRI